MLLNILMFYWCRYSTVSLSAFCPEIRLNDTKQKNPYFILMTLNFFALPFSQSQNSITEISNEN